MKFKNKRTKVTIESAQEHWEWIQFSALFYPEEGLDLRIYLKEMFEELKDWYPHEYSTTRYVASMAAFIKINKNDNNIRRKRTGSSNSSVSESMPNTDGGTT